MVFILKQGFRPWWQMNNITIRNVIMIRLQLILIAKQEFHQICFNKLLYRFCRGRFRSCKTGLTAADCSVKTGRWVFRDRQTLFTVILINRLALVSLKVCLIRWAICYIHTNQETRDSVVYRLNLKTYFLNSRSRSYMIHDKPNCTFGTDGPWFH